MQPEDSMQLPIICLTTKDGTVYGVGHTPSYPKHISKNPIYQEILKNEKSDSDCHVVNGIHEQPDGAMIEILTGMSLTQEELDHGVRAVTMVKIPNHEISSIKAGYVRGMPSTTEEE
jgi:hypothetical protein